MTTWQEIKNMTRAEKIEFVLCVLAMAAFVFLVPWLLSVGCIAVGGSVQTCGV